MVLHRGCDARIQTPPPLQPRCPPIVSTDSGPRDEAALANTLSSPWFSVHALFTPLEPRLLLRGWRCRRNARCARTL
ncbi:hypothetical protein MRX96_003826 [Rhipicephalus microplus]